MKEVVKAHFRLINGKKRKIEEHVRDRDPHKVLVETMNKAPVTKANHSRDKFSITIRNATPAKAMQLSNMLNNLGVEFSVNQ